MRKLTGLLLASALACLSLVACGTDPYGHTFVALNQSDRDVIVEVVTDDTRVLRLPAHTRGNLSEGWSEPLEGWRLTVRDSGCAELGTFSLEGKPTRLTLWVDAAGGISLASPAVFTVEGKEVQLTSPLPPASCG